MNSAVKRLIKATGFSWDGLKTVFGSEAAFRQEIILCAVLTPVSSLVHTTAAGHALLIGSLFLVLIAEILNSAIEACINRISTDIHPLSKRAKDSGSAAVFLALLNAVCIWIIILCF